MVKGSKFSYEMEDLDVYMRIYVINDLTPIVKQECYRKGEGVVRQDVFEARTRVEKSVFDDPPAFGNG